MNDHTDIVNTCSVYRAGTGPQIIIMLKEPVAAPRNKGLESR